MSAAGGDWRNGSAYDYVDQLGIGKIAHEFLRRNDDYVADYTAFRAAPIDEQSQLALTRWGLRFLQWTRTSAPTIPSRCGCRR